MGHAHDGISLSVYSHDTEGDMDDVSAMLDDNLVAQIERGLTHLK